MTWVKSRTRARGGTTDSGVGRETADLERIYLSFVLRILEMAKSVFTALRLSTLGVIEGF